MQHMKTAKQSVIGKRRTLWYAFLIAGSEFLIVHDMRAYRLGYGKREENKQDDNACV